MTESKNILEVFKSLSKKINFQKQKLEGEIDTLKGAAAGRHTFFAQIPQ